MTRLQRCPLPKTTRECLSALPWHQTAGLQAGAVEDAFIHLPSGPDGVACKHQEEVECHSDDTCVPEPNCSVTEGEVKQTNRNLKHGKANGVDRMSGEWLKQRETSIASLFFQQNSSGANKQEPEKSTWLRWKATSFSFCCCCCLFVCLLAYFVVFDQYIQIDIFLVVFFWNGLNQM